MPIGMPNCCKRFATNVIAWTFLATAAGSIAWGWFALHLLAASWPCVTPPSGGFAMETHVYCLRPNEVGDTLSGMFAPFALIVLVGGAFLQGWSARLQRIELAENREFLQSEEAERMLDHRLMDLQQYVRAYFSIENPQGNETGRLLKGMPDGDRAFFLQLSRRLGLALTSDLEAQAYVIEKRKQIGPIVRRLLEIAAVQGVRPSSSFMLKEAGPAENAENLNRLFAKADAAEK